MRGWGVQRSPNVGIHTYAQADYWRLPRSSDFFSATKLEKAADVPKKVDLTLSIHVFRDIFPNAHSSPKCTHKSPDGYFTRHKKSLVGTPSQVRSTYLSFGCTGASLLCNISENIMNYTNLISFMLKVICHSFSSYYVLPFLLSCT